MRNVYDRGNENENKPVRYALPEYVGDEFVGRREELAYLRRIIGRAPQRRAYSIALIARKGMGKTALMQRFFNLLFFDREFGVAPIYLSLAEYRPERRADRIIPKLTIRQFCELYLSTYVRHLLAYRTEDVELVRRKRLTLPQLAVLAEERGHTDLAKDAAEAARQLESERYLLDPILTWPSMNAYSWEKPYVYMIDEFQVTHGIYTDDRQHVTTIKENFQPVAEARWSPLIVSGSIVSLVTEVVMSGLLARRFAPHYLYELKPDEARELIDLISHTCDLPVSPEVAEALVVRTGGHPFYLWTILNSPALADCPAGLISLVTLDEVIQYEMSNRSALLRLYWEKNFKASLQRVNSEGLGEAILYWIASGKIEGEATPWKLVPLLRANRPSTGSGHRFDQVSEREVAEKMRELYEIDLLQEGLALHAYEGLRDPVIADFVRQSYYRNILRWGEREIENSWRRRYYELLGQTNHFKGRVAEGYVQELMRAFDGQEVDGETYFGVAGQVGLPSFAEVRLRGGIVRDGRPLEIDVLGEQGRMGEGETGREGEGERVWMVEVKYRTEPMEKGEAEVFLAKAAQVTAEYDYGEPVLWAVSRAGFTAPAEALLAERGVLRSDVKQFNALATALETLLLPE